MNKSRSRLFAFIVTTAILSLPGLAGRAEARDLSLAWEMPPDGSGTNIVGYKVHYGVASRDYSQVIDVGNATSVQLTGLDDETTYYIACTSYGPTGEDESPYSAELIWEGLDFTPPQLESLAVLPAGVLRVTFSEELDPATAVVLSNYAIDGGVQVVSAELLSDGRTVELGAQGLLDQQSYILTVSGVTDRADPPNAVAAGTQVVFTCELPSRITEGLLVLYDFEEGTGGVVHDVSGTGAPLDLAIENSAAVAWDAEGGLTVNASTRLMPEGSATKLYQACTESGEITVEAWVVPANVTQSGPARIVSFSQDSGLRNITLGQAQSAYVARLRTTATGDNGTNPQLASSSGEAAVALQHVVFTRTAAGAATLYLNGSVIGSESLGGDLSNWDASYGFLLANEMTGDRPWLGRYALVALYGRALTAADVEQNFLAGHGGGGSQVERAPLPPSNLRIVAALD